MYYHTNKSWQKSSRSFLTASLSPPVSTVLSAPTCFVFVLFLFVCMCLCVFVCILGHGEHRGSDCFFGGQFEESGVRVCLQVHFQGNTQHKHQTGVSRICFVLQIRSVFIRWTHCCCFSNDWLIDWFKYCFVMMGRFIFPVSLYSISVCL